MIFNDRKDAGKQMAAKLLQYKDNKDAVILALPRGGVVNGYEIAKELNLPLDIIVPRKIGAPNNPEFAIGAITEDGEPILERSIIDLYNISDEYIKNEIEKEKKEAIRRLKKYRGDRPPLDLKNKIAIIVDDGIATGATMRAAVKSAKVKGAKQIIIAVPVSAKDSFDKIKKEVNEIISLYIPDYFGAVGAFYKDFSQTEDEEVIELLKK